MERGWPRTVWVEIAGVGHVNALQLKGESMSRDAKEPLLLFFCFFLLYAATTSGDLIADSEVRWRVAEHIVDTGWVAVEFDTGPLPAMGRDGEFYIVWNPGQPLCLVPFVLAGRLAASLPLPFDGSPRMFGQFLAGVVFFPACGALSLVLVYSIALGASGDRRIARWIAIVVGLATMHWHHSVSTGDETQVAVCVLTCLWALQRADRRDHWRYLVLAFAAAGLGLWFRLPSVVISGPILLVGFLSDLLRRRPPRARLGRAVGWAIAAGVGLLPFLIGVGMYNFVRFGSVVETGYGQALREGLGVGVFDTPLQVGLPAMLFSPGKGVFVFNPLLILTVPGVFALWRSDRRLAAIVALTFFASVLFHCRYTVWSGDLTWGTRFLASQMGIWMLALIPVLRWPRIRPLFLTLFAISVAIQFASVVYNYGLEFWQDRRHGLVPDAYVWRPTESQLVCRFRNIALHVFGRPIYRSIPPPVERPELCQTTTSPEAVKRMHVVHFFPFKAYANTGNKALFAALLTVWLAILAALAATVWRWWRALRTTSPV
jgi:hypothetical protein